MSQMPREPRTLEYPAIKSMADSLVRQLADPRATDVCPICLGDFASRVNGEWLAHLPRLRAECHALFDAAIATLAQQRTPEERVALPHQLKSSLLRCDTHRRMRHLRVRDPTLYVSILLECTSNMFCAALQDGDHAFSHRAARAGKAFADRQGRWPVRPEQLFPAGERETVENLLCECEQYLSTGPLDALTSLILVARPIVFPILASDALRPRLVAVFLGMLDPAGAGSARWLMARRSALETACDLLDCLTSGPGALPGEGSRLLTGQEHAFLRTVAAVTEHMPDSDPLLPTLFGLCPELAARSGVPVPLRAARWHKDALARCGRNQLPISEQFCGKILLLLRSRACAGPGCTVSMLQNEGGKPFPACARCKVPRYCSRACQRADWRGEGGHAPHKIICGIFCEINAHECTEKTLKQFAEAFRRSELDDDDHDAVCDFLASFCCHSGCHTQDVEL